MELYDENEQLFDAEETIAIVIKAISLSGQKPGLISVYVDRLERISRWITEQDYERHQCLNK